MSGNRLRPVEMMSKWTCSPTGGKLTCKITDRKEEFDLEISVTSFRLHEPKFGVKTSLCYNNALYITMATGFNNNRRCETEGPVVEAIQQNICLCHL